MQDARGEGVHDRTIAVATRSRPQEPKSRQTALRIYEPFAIILINWLLLKRETVGVTPVSRNSRNPPAPATREVAWAAGPRADKTRQHILDAANRMFLERSFSAVRVDDIAAEANVSRATFYVYFPSKRDVFLALGIDSIAAGNAVADALDKVPKPFTDGDLEGWVDLYLEYLEHYGAFIRSWDEALANDSQLQLQSHFNVQRFCRRLGLSLERLRGRPEGDATLQGLALRGSIDGVWYFWRLSEMAHERNEIVHTLVRCVRLHTT